MEIHQLTQPETEPVTLAEARRQVRAALNEHDDDLIDFIRAAREAAETYTNTIIARRNFAAVLPAFADEIRLPRPTETIVSVTYRDAAGDTQTLDPLSYYLNRSASVLRLLPLPGATYPATGDYFDAVTVTFTAGWQPVPYDMQLAIRMLLTMAFEHRGSEPISVPPNVEWMLHPYRIYNA